MDEVWIMHWEKASESDSVISVWESEMGALKDATDRIQHAISKYWDLSEDTEIEVAEGIERAVNRGTITGMRTAITSWNDYQTNSNQDEAEYYNVVKRDVQVLGLIVKSSSGPAKTTSGTGYRASTPGATCRGPCGNSNEYAYADKPDGTYVCHQCGTFQSIFGTP